MPSAAPDPPRPQRLGAVRACCRVRSAGVAASLAAALSVVLAGCAAPGEPTPRRPVVPQAVADLSAQQQGDAVLLRFTPPADSTRQQPLAALPTVEIYRATTPPAQMPAMPQPPRLVDTVPGELLESYMENGRVEFSDPLDPAELAQHPGERLAYTVRTRVSARYASAASNVAILHVYPAPPAVGDLRATLSPQAVNLAWSPPQSPGGAAAAAYRVYRAELQPSAASTAAANPSRAARHAPLRLLGQTSAPGYRDTNFEFGRTYLYIVRGVAQAGEASVESANSNAVVLSARDVFPPAAPQAPVAVLVPATAHAPAYVDLTWTLGAEPDLAGYDVFRSDQSGIPGRQLNTRLLPAPPFRDMSVSPGHRYFYSVRAVDRAGNQSPFSTTVVVDVPGM